MNVISFLRRTVFILGLLACFAVPALAAPVKADHLEAELVSEVDAIQPGKPFWVALRFKFEEHWHTYWKYPGDSGLPTSIEWKLPAGFTAGEIQWEHPVRIEVAGLAGYGYEGEVYHLVQITPPATLKPGESVTLAAKAKWLVCKESCIPGSADLTLPLAVKAAAVPSALTQAFSDARAKLPLAQSEWKVRATKNGDKLALVLTPPAGTTDLTSLNYFPDKELVIEDGEPQKLQRVKAGFLLETVPSKVAQTLPATLTGVLVTKDGWRGPGSEKALAVNVPVEPATAFGDGLTVVAGTVTKSPAKPLGFQLLLVALGSAFLGGLILNLMPCVLPVLSIKVLGFVEQAKDGHSKPWQHGMVFAAGVLISFWTLAGALLALRAGGNQLGWGFQLQEPAFVTALAAILFLFGLVLFGVFEVGTSLMSVGSGAMQKSGFGGSFFSGVLATVVATPCTAPFMGSALGVALAQPAWVAFIIFTSLALGMAAPYVVFSASPALMKFIPRPGAWMEAFKQGMGFLMMMSVVWLLWVLGQQVGVDGVAVALLAFILMGFGGWVLGRWATFTSTNRTRRIAQIVAAIFIFGGGFWVVYTARTLPQVSANEKKTSTDKDAIQWETFSPQRIAELQAAGKPVFVDFTAAWCLSCKANERVAIDVPEVKAEIKKRGIVMMKADWTNRDETITKTLAEFDRSGVPLYVFYAGKNEPKVLPEVITSGIVLDALRTAN
jgi:thiol:disulfide interchange protein/DsbC/DsbD-like thiol-disulfide interchange protein